MKKKTNAQLQEELNSAMAWCQHANEELRKASAMLKAAHEDSNTAKSKLRELESKLKTISTSLETFAAIKFPEEELMTYQVGKRNDLPEIFLAIRHLYELAKLTGWCHALPLQVLESTSWWEEVWRQEDT